MENEIIEAELIAINQAEDYYRAEHLLAHFLRSAWHLLEPGREYLHNWHVDCIAEHLEAVRLGQIRRLIVNQPPRSLKSTLITVCFPVWLWIKDPARRFMCASYADRLSTKHNMDRRSIIESSWYKTAWGGRFTLAPDQNEKTKFMNDHRGQMFSTSVGGSGTGEGADIIVIDDPQNPEMSESEAERERVIRWYDGTMSSRLNDKKKGAEIIVMQRLHEKDLTGHLLGKEDGSTWTHLCLQAEATKKQVFVFPVSKREVVREEGDILHSDREGPAELKIARIKLGPRYQGQYQQDPRPMDGGFFKRSWWKFYRELPMQRTRRVQFWDCAEKPGVSTDFSVCETWDETPVGYFLVDVWRQRVAFPELESAAQNLFAQYHPDAVVIEDKSAGVQLIQNLRAKTTLPVVPYNPGRRDKVVRAAGAQPTVMAGNCYLPLSRPWVELFISECETFPNAEHDDQVDPLSMMVEFFRNNGIGPRIRTL